MISRSFIVSFTFVIVIEEHVVFQSIKYNYEKEFAINKWNINSCISDYRISAVHNKTNVETRLGDDWEYYVGASDL